MEYEELLEKIIKLLSKTKYSVLATASKEGIVTSSKMCMISDGLKVYFQTDKNFEKARNIMENPNVAITIGNIYFKGQATIIGSPKENDYFVTKMKEQHYETYENYTELPDQILIEVKLTECRIWGFWNDETLTKKEEAIQVLNFQEQTKRKIKCKNLKGGY